MARVIIVGRVASVESKYLPSGTTLTTLSVAENQSVKVNGQWETKSIFHRVSVFGKRGEYANSYVGVGCLVHIEGELDYGSSETNGEKKYWTNITCTDLKRLTAPTKSKTSQSSDGKNSGEGQEYTHQEPDYSVEDNPDFASDDIPF